MPKKSLKTNKNSLSQSSLIESDVEQLIMERIRSQEIKMKPKWWFALGSIISLIGIAGSLLGAVFLVHLAIFSSKQHGPMGEVRFQFMINSFPWWIPVIAIILLIVGIYLLHKSTSLYKHNIIMITIIITILTLIAGMILSQSGLGEKYFHVGPLRRWQKQEFFQQNDFYDQKPRWRRNLQENYR